MEELKVTGLIIRVTDHKENDKLAHLLTPDKGKVAIVFKGVKKPNAKLRSFAQPLTFAEFLLVRRSGFFTVTSCSLVDNFYSLAYDSERFFAACTVLEAGDIGAREDLADGQLLAVMLRALKELTYSEQNSRIILVKFLTMALKTGGYSLSFEDCAACHTDIGERFFIDPTQGGAVCSLCRTASARPIRVTTLNSLRFIDNTDIDKLNTLTVAQDDVTAALRAAVWSYESAYDARLKSAKNIIDPITHRT